MKKLLMILLLASLLPLAAFAQLQIGPTAFYNFPLGTDNSLELPAPEGIGLSDFTFGGDVRLRFLGLFHGGAFVLVTPGGVEEDGNGTPIAEAPTEIDLHTRIGLNLEFLFLRFSAGIGPSFGWNIYQAQENEGGVSIGSNLATSLELVLGGFSIGVNYLLDVPFSITDASKFIDADKSKGLFGISVLFQL